MEQESVIDMCKYFLRPNIPAMEWSIWVTPVFLSLVLSPQKLPTLDCATFSEHKVLVWAKKVAFSLSMLPGICTTEEVNWKWTGGNENSERFSQNGCISRSLFCLLLCFLSRSLLMPRCSSAVGSAWPCAWGHRTVRSCSSPGWWRSGMTGRCRSRCSTVGGLHTPPRAGRPGSSWRWWWPGWGPGCTATSCPSLRRGSPEAQMMGMLCSTQGTVELHLVGLCHWKVVHLQIHWVS